MKIDGIQPSQGQPVEGKPKTRKAGEGGSSFAAALGKAMGNDAKPAAAPVPEKTDLEDVKNKVKAGFYKTGAIDDAVSDKLSGYFDQLA